MELRPPVVAIMGHIDHGKSTLLDYIRKENTTEREAGGITQHLAAYEALIVSKDTETTEGVSPKKITFIDTPGHEAFGGIRRRGARAADIAVLVVSAEDGPKPQTLEAYERITESSTPLIVAITKIDKPNADIERVKAQLADAGILVEGYGGDIPLATVSGKTGEGVDDLLETILLVAEIERCGGDADRWGTGVILESRLDPKRGILAVGVVKDGTVRTGMFAAAPGAVAPLRYLLDGEGGQVEELSFSSPIQIAGWSAMPPVGSSFETFEDREAADLYAESEGAKYDHAQPRPASKDESIATLPIIVKADTASSLEAIRHELGKLVHERIRVHIVLDGVGDVSEGDVKTGLASGAAAILGFNVRVDSQAAASAERTGPPIETFDIIYKLTERVTNLLDEMTPTIETEEVRGRATVLKLFSKTKQKQVIGARVESGTFKVGDMVTITRHDQEIGRGRILGLQRAKAAVESVGDDAEFGSLIESKEDIAPSDTLSAVATVTS